MSPKLYTHAEMRSRNLQDASSIANVILNGSVRASSNAPDGDSLYDEQTVLIAASVRDAERRCAARGEAIRSTASDRARQYAS